MIKRNMRVHIHATNVRETHALRMKNQFFAQTVMSHSDHISVFKITKKLHPEVFLYVRCFGSVHIARDIWNIARDLQKNINVQNFDVDLAINMLRMKITNVS